MNRTGKLKTEEQEAEAHVMHRLFEMLSRWPRYLSHGPAAEMWSVVHLPLILIRTSARSMLFPSHASNGSSSCRRVLFGSTFTDTLLACSTVGGAWYVGSPTFHI